MQLDEYEPEELPEHFCLILDELGPYPGGIVVPEKPKPTPKPDDYNEDVGSAVSVFDIKDTLWLPNDLGVHPGTVTVRVEADYRTGSDTWKYTLEKMY